MNETIVLDSLSIDKVTVKKVTKNDEGQIVGIWSRGYVNTDSTVCFNRTSVENDVPEPHRTAIFAIWGETATVTYEEL